MTQYTMIEHAFYALCVNYASLCEFIVAWYLISGDLHPEMLRGGNLLFKVHDLIFMLKTMQIIVPDLGRNFEWKSILYHLLVYAVYLNIYIYNCYENEKIVELLWNSFYAVECNTFNAKRKPNVNVKILFIFNKKTRTNYSTWSRRL